MTTRLRAGHLELWQNLNVAANNPQFPTQPQLVELLCQARDAVLTCPHEKCAYCGAVEKETP